jgi:hypothetical protein
MRLSDAGLRQRQTKLIYPDHRPTPCLTEDVPRDRSNRLLDDSSRFEPTLGQIRWRAPFCVERLFHANKRFVFRDGSIQCVRFSNMTHRVGKRDAPYGWIVVMSDQ